LVNQNRPASIYGQTPGVFDLSVLDEMSTVPNTDLSLFSKLFSIRELPLLGSDNALPRLKRFSYTTHSLGVLCDVKNGGLKRDLTIAFEDDTTFNEVFPRGAGNYTADYLCIDPDKLGLSPELSQNGYIHWEVFKDHYNIKRHIKTYDASESHVRDPKPSLNGTMYLDPVRYTKDGPFLGYQFNGTINHRNDPNGANGWLGSNFMAGRLGPHDIGDNEFYHVNGPYDEMMGMPYGDYQVEPTWPAPATPKNHEEFKHSPVIPVLQRFQVNAWMEQLDNRNLRTHAQIWSSHYNPYNIALYVAGNSGGPRMLGTPLVKAFSNALNNPRRFEYLHENQNETGDRMTTSYLHQVDFTSFKFEFHASDTVMLLPGRSHVLAFEDAAQIGVERTSDGLLYNDKVKDLTVQSVYKDIECVSGDPDLPASFDLELRMQLRNASLHHGVDDNNGGYGNFEVHQSFWAPFAWDNVGDKPGKVFNLGTVSSSNLNENNSAKFGFNLRTTREPGSTIRPLVDANIRCLFGNTRWDSPLNLPLLAGYSVVNDGVESKLIMDMDVSDDPRGYSFWGADRDSTLGYDRVILFDIPRSDLISLGQLQHAGAGRFSYEPTYIVGNSYANPRMSQTNWKESVEDTFSTSAPGLDRFPIDDPFNLYDASYLVNEVLWDRYIFTTIPQVADNVSPSSSLSVSEPDPDDAHFSDLASGNAKLPNARYIPYSPEGSNFDRSTLQAASDKAAGTGSFYHNAGHLLVDGAFNVNSTSVDAWEAFLSGTHSLPFEKLDEDGEVVGFDAAVDGVRFPRVQHVFGSGVATDDLSDLDESVNFWTGFRDLEQSEVRTLAQEIVAEIKLRGPFLSLADFVNRKLESGTRGEAGALQAALDRTVNTGLDADITSNDQASGFPGYLLQGDLLQALAPYMNVRSDTFTIRAYGQSANANTGTVQARAWCEAKVQRYPDPVEWGGTTGTALENLSNPPSPLGRKFKIVSFRWLNPEEI
jgi:hypothetical protein